MITSTANQRIKRVIQLSARASLRKKEGVFVAEGVKMFLEAPGYALQETYISEGLFQKASGTGGEKLYEKLYEKLQGLPYEIVTDRVFEKMSDTRSPQGILSVAEQPFYSLDELKKLSEKPLFLLLENLQDPGNLGTILRTAEGAGVTAVIMSRDTVDVFNPKTIRSTMGSVYRLPFMYAGDGEEFREMIRSLRETGVRIFAAHLKGTTSYDRKDYRNSTAFLIGNEGNGLTEETAKMADEYIRIPMAGKIESLNAGVASALLMYEAARQRGFGEGI